MNSNLTVCILTAGKGSRMGALGTKLNKSLHVINGRAIISLIIEKFPKNTEFVIALGFLGSQVRTYLSMAHPDLNVKFIKVKNFDGVGGGPGLSLLSCLEFLQKPFYFVSCDTLWSNKINLASEENWVGVSNVKFVETKNYCNFKIKNNKVIDIVEKQEVREDMFKAFVGLCFIYDFSKFWNGIKTRQLEAGEHQISSGLRELISKSIIKAVDIDWQDVGDENKFKTIASKYENFDFSKDDEVLYIFNGKVIKFFSDKNITSNRVSKSILNKNVFPKITFHNDQFYSYNFIKGETLYKKNSEKIFSSLLKWLLKNLWIDVDIPQEKMKEAQDQIKKIEVEGEAGGNLVKVVLSGDYELKSITISDAAKKESQEIINDLIIAAYNNAKENLKKKSAEELSKATGGLKLPLDFKLPF